MRQKFRLPFILTTLGLCKKGGAQKYINDSIFFFFNLVLPALSPFPWRLCGCVSLGGWRPQKKTQPGLFQSLRPHRSALGHASVAPCYSCGMNSKRKTKGSFACVLGRYIFISQQKSNNLYKYLGKDSSLPLEGGEVKDRRCLVMFTLNYPNISAVLQLRRAEG